MIIPILILGLALRLIFLNQSLWLDEATTALVSKMSLNDIFTKFLPGDFHPPLYYLIMKYWVLVFGNSEISLRIPSVLFGVATIYIVYKISKNYIAPVLLATSGLAVYYSQEARMYGLVALLVSYLVYLFIEKKWFIFSIILLILGMTDYLALLIIPIFFLADPRNWKKLVMCHLPLTIGFLFWLPIFLKQWEVGLLHQGSYWWGILGTPTLKNILLIPVKFIFGRISIDDKTLYLIIASIAVVIFTYILVKIKSAPKIFWLWLTVPIILGILISFKVPTLTYFRYLFCLPALYILISKTKASKYLIFIIVLTNILSTIYYLLTPRFHRENWREAAFAIGDKKIVFPANSQKEALTYYGKGSQVISVQEITPDIDGFWLSRYVWEIFDPTDSARVNIEKLGYNKTSEHNFNGVVFFKYKQSLLEYHENRN